MPLPNYENSIVNLVSTISKSFDAKSRYGQLRTLKSNELKNNVVLLVVDGLGYEWLKKNGKGSFLKKNLKARMTSVFPSTTVAALTALQTGLAPQQHGLTGWFMYLKEIGAVSTILRFMPRYTKNEEMKLGKAGIAQKDIFGFDSVFDKFDARVSEISNYGRIGGGKTKMIPYSTMNDMIKKILSSIKSEKKRNFVYAYWPGFDLICHEHGVGSREARKEFAMLDKGIEKLAKSLDGNTTLIVTADHGLIDIPENRRIFLSDHPKLAECLTLPLCGEVRAAYCYVKPSKTKQFERYIRTRFAKQCTLFKSEKLIAKGYYGLFEQNPKLADRVGDYVLIMKDNWTIKDFILGEGLHKLVAYHGGISKDEMFVPLIVL